jgi:metal-responsive CopG/Arc/MetJ family transcriptional regulator
MMYDNGIMRTIIDLPDEQVNALKALCESQSISRAEAVRRALSEMLANQKSAGREAAFGAWRGRKLDSRKFVDALREEWE